MVDTGFDDLPLLRASTLVQQVHSELKARIIDGRLSPGDEVPDSVIAKQMGVSRAPVRDACNILVQSGLLTKQQNYPYRVRDFSAADLTEMQLIRWAYESAAARHLVRSGTVPRNAASALEKMHAAQMARDGEASGEADLAFHLSLVEATGLPELIRRYDTLLGQLRIVMGRIPKFALSSQVHRHQELFDSLRQCQSNGDPRPLLVLLDAHLLTRREDVEESDLSEAASGRAPATI